MAISQIIQERRGNKMRFQGASNHRPTPEEIADAQREEGYWPEGYGGPFDINIYQVTEDGGYIVEWSCWGSAD